MKLKIEKRDYFFFAGLPVFGVGLFLWFGFGVSLAVSGLILMLTGILGK